MPLPLQASREGSISGLSLASGSSLAGGRVMQISIWLALRVYIHVHSSPFCKNICPVRGRTQFPSDLSYYIISLKTILLKTAHFKVLSSKVEHMHLGRDIAQPLIAVFSNLVAQNSFFITHFFTVCDYSYSKIALVLVLHMLEMKPECRQG